MKTLVFCAVVIAASTFTMAVEDVYGWSKLRPHAEAAWGLEKAFTPARGQGPAQAMV